MARQIKHGDRFFRNKAVRLISPTNEQLGIVQFEEALAKADELGLDLVEVAAKADPPVCRIMDYGKQLYEQSKRQREANKKQHHHKVKEIKFHPNIDVHDYKTKLRRAVEFLGKGDKVKVSMFFRGREMAHTDLGQELMERVVTDLEEVGAADSSVRRQGRMIAVMISPKKSKTKK